MCEDRDAKGLYKKARAGIIKGYTSTLPCDCQWLTCVYIGFTGIDQAYEAPEKPDLVLKGGQWSVDDSLSKLVDMLRRQVGMILTGWHDNLDYFVALLQHIIPIDSKQTLEELFVSPERLEEVMEEAEEMPKLTINKLDLQWVQVGISFLSTSIFHNNFISLGSE